ncbi:MAG TPA: acyl-CoA dehydrogenase family protein [Dehalococcoidia bacterium]
MTATMSDVTSEELIGRVQALTPSIRAQAPRFDEERRLPQELVDEMRAAGLFHMLLPREYGGSQTDPVTSARVIEEVARADGSAGWCVMIAAQTCGFAGLLQPDAAREIWGGGRIVAGVGRPIGRAVIDEARGGYVVSGRWPFASGSSHAAWLGGEAIVYDGDKERFSESGEAETVMAFFPRAQGGVIDNWDTLGLRGTASGDITADGVFVPFACTAYFTHEPYSDWALYRCLPLVFINHGSHALGVARAALEHATALIQAKRGWGNVPLRDVPRMQAALAEASVIVDAAATHLYDVSQRLWELVTAGSDDAVLRAKVRLAASHAAQESQRAVDILHSLLATSAIAKSSLLERCFRDIHTATAHVMIGPLTYEAGGRVLLGKDVDFPFF